MREILFRGKRKDNKAWEDGSLVITRSGCYDQQVFISDKMTGYHTPVIPETVCQYTGLTDKNGRKIFEGDILKIAKAMDGMGGYYDPPLDYPVIVVVKWDLCSWLWETLNCKPKRYISFPEAWCHFVCEVIGNIYDNPELLEVKQNG